MKKQLVLDYDFEEDYYAIEVRSPLQDYEFAWMINKEMNVKFRRSKHFYVIDKNASSSEFALFVWQRLEKVTYFLSYPCSVSNSLMPEYYFFIQGAEHERIIDEFINKLRDLPDVVSAEYIHIGELEDLPPKQQTSAFQKRIHKFYNILFDLEEHLRELKRDIKAQKTIIQNNMD